jgi:hypothetical protein
VNAGIADKEKSKLKPAILRTQALAISVMGFTCP